MPVDYANKRVRCILRTCWIMFGTTNRHLETKFHTQVFPANDTTEILQLEQNINIAFRSINDTVPRLLNIKANLQRECNYALQLRSNAAQTRVKRFHGVFGFIKFSIRWEWYR